MHLDDNGVLQCTSCHDPHKNNRDATCTKFLVTSNNSAALCTACHQKRYWTVNAAHQTSTATFSSSQGQHTGYTTVATNGCESCHKPHKALQSLQILNGSEEATCVTCHKGNGGNTATNISNGNTGPYTKTYTHPTFTVSGKHVPVTLNPRTANPSEDVANLSGTNRHAECQDCHNPHAAGTRTGKSGNHYNGTNSYPTSNVSSSLDLTGVWGVEPPLAGAWITPAQAGYTRQDPSTYEYQICYKCHTAYAFGNNPPASPSSGTNGVVNETDQALEFNPANASYHGVAGTPIVGVRGYYANASWNATSRMYCSDCHGDNDANTGWTVPAAAGPHGSNNPFILRGAWNSATGINKQSDLCFRCHDYNSFINGNNPGLTKFSKSNYGDDMHTKHVKDFGKPCMACHTAVPHGWKRASMIVYSTDPAPYSVAGVSKITAWTRSSGNYEITNCTTVANGGCH